MKTITIDYELYEKELASARSRGYEAGLTSFRTALRERDNGNHGEAELILIEDFGKDADKIAKQLGIKFTAGDENSGSTASALLNR